MSEPERLIFSTDAAALLAASPRTRSLPARTVAPTMVVLGVAVWARGLAAATPAGTTILGLLIGSNIWLPLGFLLVVLAGVGEAVSATPRFAVAGGALIAFIVMTYTTVPIVFGAPEYPWVYKHIGVITGFQRFGRVTAPWDIYDEWPTLFAGVAQVASLAHVNTVSFAAWAPLFFELANALLVLGIVRQLTENRRLAWIAVWIYAVSVTWVGQDYLSPQAFAYLLWLGIALIALRWLRSPHQDRPGARLRWQRLREWLRAPAPAQPDTTPRLRLAAAALVALIFVAVTTAHQLTPYMVIASFLGLAIFGLFRPRLLLPILVAIAVGYLALHWHLIKSQYGGLFGGDPLTNASGAASSSHPSGSQIWSWRCVYLVMASMWLGGAAAFFMHIRRPGAYLAPAILAAAPFAMVFGTSYGGEVIFRVFLFTAPWAAYLIASALSRLSSLPWRLAVLLAVGVLAAASLQGLYANSYAYAFTAGDIATAKWLTKHVAPSAIVVDGVSNLPLWDPPGDDKFAVDTIPGNVRGATEASTVAVAAWIQSLGHREVYIVTSDTFARWAAFFEAPPGYAQLSDHFRNGFMGAKRVFVSGGTTVYRVRLRS